MGLLDKLNLKEFWEDTVDFFEDDLPGLVNLLIKIERIKFQGRAVKAINAVEEQAVSAALAAIGAEIPLPNEILDSIEATIRKTYWYPLDELKKYFGADWLIDT